MSDGILFIFLGALLHPFRDILLKFSSHRQGAYFILTGCWVIFAFLHSFFLQHSFFIPTDLWGALIVSSLGLTGYYYGLSYCSKHGDISVCYPIIRSSPLLILFCMYFLWNIHYTLITVVGVFVTMAGIYALTPKINLLRVASPAVLFFALLAMAGSAVSSIADSAGMYPLRFFAKDTSVQPVAISTWLFWGYLLIFLNLNIITLMQGEHKIMYKSIMGNRRDYMLILSSLFTGYGSYFLILMAFREGVDATIVSTLRQLSLIISLVMAHYFLSEKVNLMRIISVVIIASGLIMVMW